MKIKTLGSISASKDIIFSIRVPENNYSEMNKLPDTLVCGETDALRAWIRPRKAYPRLLVIIGRNGDPKISFYKFTTLGNIHYLAMPHYLVPVGCQKISLRRTALVVRAPLDNSISM